jgi:hypothetical protein
LKHFFTFLESFVIVVLVAAGLAGLFYNTFRGGGWFDAAFERVMAVVFTNMTASIIIGCIGLVAFVMWYERHVAKGTYNKRVPTIVLYVLVAAGVYYVGRYALFGTL